MIDTGKSDTLAESPFSTARREAFEEIGLPQTDDKIPGFSVEHICELPASLAKTELGVRPCVAFLYPSNSSPTSASTSAPLPPTSTSTTDSLSPSTTAEGEEEPSVEEKLIPRLNPGEVAAVFTAPFQSFLRKEWTGAGPGPVQKNGKPEKWYRGSWTEWNESRWRMHNFYIPRPLAPPSSSQNSSVSVTPGSSPVRGHAFANSGEDDASGIEEPTNFRVWGMTARILVDAARLAYGQEPEFQHNSHFGDEALIERLLKVGRMDKRAPSGEGASREVVREASKI